jgi:hypothetical protein
VFVREGLPNLLPGFVVVDADRGGMMGWSVIGPGDLSCQHVLGSLKPLVANQGAGSARAFTIASLSPASKPWVAKCSTL